MKIRIESERSGASTRIWLDEVEITRATRAVCVDWAIGHLNHIWLELLPEELVVETEGVAGDPEQIRKAQFKPKDIIIGAVGFDALES